MSHDTDFPGYPHCPDQGTLTRITVDNRAFLLHREVAPLFQLFLDEVVRRGYRLDRGDQLDDWSFACRPIRGSTKGSEHSRGTAVDVNATTNPMLDHLVTDMPSWMPVLAAQYGIGWGGYYGSRPDAMHYEFTGTITQARALVAKWTGTHPTQPNDNLPGIGPEDPKGTVLFLQSVLNLIRASQHKTAIRVDGAYGDQTKAAVAELQREWNSVPAFTKLPPGILLITGRADPKTCDAIGIAVKLIGG